MRRLASLVLVSLLFPFIAQSDDFDFRDFDRYQETLSAADVQAALKLYLVKSPEILDQISVTSDSFSIYADSEDKKNDRPEYVLKFGKRKQEEPLVPGGASLKGMRIAIDPGHFGGAMAKLEERYVDMKPVPETGNKAFQFDEGTLTALTGRYLKKLFEDSGADVLLTRDTPGKGVLKENFEEWMKSGSFDAAVEAKVATITDPQKQADAKSYWHKEAKPNVIFRILYNNADLRARTKMINEFKPDLTLAIHYNAGGDNDKTTGQNLGTKENYNMIFTAGAFMKGELADKEARYEFVRLLVSKDLQQSIRLGQILGREFEDKLKVSLIPNNAATPTNYLSKSCLPVGNGVFCRNLPLTRLPHCPMVYGETLYQDNFEECQRLASTDLDVDGYKTSPRVKEVAEAYFRAVILVYGK